MSASAFDVILALLVAEYRNDGHNIVVQEGVHFAQIELFERECVSVVTDFNLTRMADTIARALQIRNDDKTHPRFIAGYSAGLHDGKLENAPPIPRADTFESAIDTDTPLQAAAREAGWALMELVDGIAWEKRGQVADIIGRLGLALNADQPSAPAMSPDHQRMIDIAEARLLAIHKALYPSTFGITGIESAEDHVGYMTSVLQAVLESGGSR